MRSPHIPVVTVAALLAACTGEPTPTPPFPTPVTEQPPPTPVIDTCDADPADYPFVAPWSPVVFAPPAAPVTVVAEGTIEIPTAWPMQLEQVEVFGVTATLGVTSETDEVRTVAFEAEVQCAAPCATLAVTVDGVRLFGPNEGVIGLDSTAYAALDVAYGFIAARNGPFGITQGLFSPIDAAVPDVRDALEDAIVAQATSYLGPDGAAEIGSPVFIAVDALLADPGLPSPTIDADDGWRLHAVAPPPGASLVIWEAGRVSLPLDRGADGELSAYFPGPSADETVLVARFVDPKGGQSAATVWTRPAGPENGELAVEATEGDAVRVTGAAPGAWVLYRSNTSGEASACAADASGEAVLSADRTTAFSVMTLDDEQRITARRSCRWSQQTVTCTDGQD